MEEEEDDVEKIIDQKANWPEAVVKDLLKIADDLTEAKRKDRKEVQQVRGSGGEVTVCERRRVLDTAPARTTRTQRRMKNDDIL